MSSTTSRSLIDEFDVSRDKVEKLVAQSLHGSEDGELYLEYAESESLVFDDGRLKNGSFNQGQGFGLRCVSGETVGYAHSGELTHSALLRASDAASAISRGSSGSSDL